MSVSNMFLCTDSCSDLSPKRAKELDVFVFYLTYIIGGIEYDGQEGQSLLTMDQFFNMMGEKKQLATTSQVSPDRFIKYWEPVIQEGRPILYLAFSSSLSGTYSASHLAKSMLLEKYPQADINIIDTACGAAVQGMLVERACTLRDRGMSVADIVSWVEAHKNNYHIMFMVDDIFHLKRGGRLSAATAIIASVLHIKPILALSEQTAESPLKLLTLTKARGLKQAIHYFCEALKNYAEKLENLFYIHVVYAENAETAKELRDAIAPLFPSTDITTTQIGPVIGAHIGSGALGIYFYGASRSKIKASLI